VLQEMANAGLEAVPETQPDADADAD
jgi:hypothetical protein